MLLTAEVSSGTSFLVPDVSFFLMLVLVAALSLLPLLAIVAIVLVVLRGKRNAHETGYGSNEARLKELARLHDDGLITQAEYDARRAAILESI